jgi:hypothetical protein
MASCECMRKKRWKRFHEIIIRFYTSSDLATHTATQPQMASHSLQHVASDERLGADPNSSSNTGNMTSCEEAAAAWTIKYFVIGKELPCSIDVKPDVTVDILKKLINTQMELVPRRDITELSLYLLNIPDDDKLVENVKQKLTAEPPLAWLLTTYKLSRYYSTAPPQRTLNASYATVR